MTEKGQKKDTKRKFTRIATKNKGKKNPNSNDVGVSLRDLFSSFVTMLTPGYL